LNDELITPCLGGTATLRPGIYFISGFWANVVGLTETLEDARTMNNKWCIASSELSKFDVEVN